MDEMLKDLNGPWSNAAAMGYCLVAMRPGGAEAHGTAPGAAGAGRRI